MEEAPCETERAQGPGDQLSVLCNSGRPDGFQLFPFLTFMLALAPVHRWFGGSSSQGEVISYPLQDPVWVTSCDSRVSDLVSGLS